MAKDVFHYTYSAGEQEEIRSIREKYLESEKTESKIETLRRLDAGVGKKAQGIALTLGISGALVMGIGMSLAMTELGAHFGLDEATSLVIGIPVGLLGIALVSLAYPTYQRIVKRERKRIAPQILRLTEELMK